MQSMTSGCTKMKRLLGTSRIRRLCKNTLVRICVALLLLMTIVHVMPMLHSVSKSQRPRDDVTVLRPLNSSGSRSVAGGRRRARVPAVTGTPERCNESSVRRPAMPGVEPQRWQRVARRSVNVFSAYVDRRVDAGGPLVRVIASGLPHVGTQLYCQMWPADPAVPPVIRPAVYDPISRRAPAAQSSTTWTAHFVLCPFNESSVEAAAGPPVLVSVVDQPRCVPTNVLLVLDAGRVTVGGNTTTSYAARGNLVERRRNDVSFALCLPPLRARLNLYVPRKAPAVLYQVMLERERERERERETVYSP